MVYETQTCKHLRVVIYINPCTNGGTTQLRTQNKMVTIGQPKNETILEEKGDNHIIGIENTRLGKRKRAPHNHHWNCMTC